jgi:hypothetical protein
MMKVFTIEDCQEIGNQDNKLSQVYIDKAKSFLIPYLESKNIKVKDTLQYVKHMIHTSSTKDAKEWHYDDLPIINFIINIHGEGTKLLIDNKIEVLPQGYGCMVIGDQGYYFLGLKPVLHCAPSDDKNRCLMKIMLNSNYDSGEHYIGESVCKYNSEEYKKRQSELKTMLEKDLETIKNIM